VLLFPFARLPWSVVKENLRVSESEVLKRRYETSCDTLQRPLSLTSIVSVVAVLCGRCSSQRRSSSFTKLRAIQTFVAVVRLTPAYMVAWDFCFVTARFALDAWVFVY